MPSPVKISDALWSLARAEAEGTHRSTTAQIEHWATLGRAVEVMLAYRDVLGLKRAGEHLPMPAHVAREEVHALLARLVDDADRGAAKAIIHAGGGPVYTSDPEHPGLVVEVRPDGTRTPGHFEARRFVPGPAPPAVAAARRRPARTRRRSAAGGA
jgi:hypothetical protein